jgi:hypothetical protein
MLQTLRYQFTRSVPAPVQVDESAREFAAEFAGERDVVDETKLGAGGDERSAGRRRIPLARR